MEVAPLAVAVPLLAAGGLTAVSTRVNRAAAEVVALSAVLAVTALCAILLARTGSGLEVYWFGGWEPRGDIAIGVSFAVDAVGAGLATLISVLMVGALVLMWRYRDTEAPHFQVLMLLFLAGMVGFCLSGDLFNMFVFFELMSVAAFALAAFKVEEEEAVEGSLNFAVTNTIGSFLLLTGIALVYGRTGALNLAQIGEGLAASRVDGLVVVAFALCVAGFLVKAAVVPFHFWLADAYAVAPTPVCLLFAGAMSELGVYGAGRIWFDAFAGALGSHADALRVVLITAGCLTALIGAVMSFAQDHLKRMLAFATIAYVGVFLIGLGLLAPSGVAGAATYVVADGFGKAALFAAVAIVQHRRRRVSEARLAGTAGDLPFTGLVFAAGALSFAALPPFGTFLGKSLIEDELIRQGYGVVVAVLILTSALTAGAVMRAAARIFLGWGAAEVMPSPVDETESEEEGPPTRTPAVMFVPAAALIAAALAIGLVPGVADGALDAAHRFTDGPSYARTVLDGVPPASIASLEPYSAPAHAYLYAAITLGASISFAALALFGPRLRVLRARPVEVLGQGVARLRALHSGHVGDYVAWLVAGVAALGGAFAIALA
jgi:multicomponent Na+:H+ antiporter subunit D